MSYHISLTKIFSLVLIFFSFSSHGDMFRAPYVNFDIGYKWTCKSFGVDWVCHHYLNKGAKPALILITAKEGLSSDDLGIYMEAFKIDQINSLKHNRIKKILVNQHVWVEAFHQNSILKNMFSRYTATICCEETKAKIHILIGFHAHKENYTEYSNEFLKSIKSLRLASDLKETLAQIRQQTDQQKQSMLSYIQQILFEPDLEEDIMTPAPRHKKTALWLVIGFFILFVIFIFLYVFYFHFFKTKKRKKSRK